MGTGLILDDRYQLTEPIAAGGVGQVWRAVDLLLDRPVAVKLLRPEYADHPETLERFRAEARHAGSQTHPSIARVYDYGSAGPGSPPYLVMEYVKGPSLADMLATGPVDAVLALDVVAQAAAGLDAAHRSGLVHRDIKPGNILLGDDGLVKITDFGIAHAAGSAPITGPGLVMGTTQYMAPERIGGAPATPGSDLYSLGILIYECLTGITPYDGTTAEVMAGHLYLPLPPLPAGVPAELDELVARLTAKSPAARLSDAAELAKLAGRLRDKLAAGVALPAAADDAVAAADHAALASADPRVQAILDTIAGDADADTEPGEGRAALTGQPDHPHGPGPSFRPGRRRSAALAAGATVVAGAGVVWLLAAGVPHNAPAADHAPANPPASSVPGPAATVTPSATPARPSQPAHTRRASGRRPSPVRTVHSGTAGRTAGSGAGGNPATGSPATGSGTPSRAPSPSTSTTSPPSLLPPLPLVSSLGL